MESLRNCIKSTHAYRATQRSFNSGDEAEGESRVPLEYVRSHNRGSSKFRTPEGKPIPGLSEKDSPAYAIEIAKVYLERELGERKFAEAYRFLEV